MGIRISFSLREWSACRQLPHRPRSQSALVEQEVGLNRGEEQEGGMDNRKVKLLILSFFIMCFLFAGAGCGGDSNRAECLESDSACGRFTACCSTSNCYYLADDGTRFNCNGTNCNAAAQQLAEYMCGKSLRENSQDDLSSVVDEMLDAAKAQAAAASCPTVDYF
jgi:hypothetical protein